MKFADFLNSAKRKQGINEALGAGSVEIKDKIKREDDFNNLAKLLEKLYLLDRKEFIKLIKNKIKFAYNVRNKIKGKPLRKYDSDYALIEVNVEDVINNTAEFQKIKPYYISNKNHIPAATVMSREFTIAAHLMLTNGYLDCPCIGYNNEVLFEDGRHRTVLALDCGITKLQFIIDNESLEKLEYKKPFNFKVIKI